MMGLRKNFCTSVVWDDEYKLVSLPLFLFELEQIDSECENCEQKFDYKLECITYVDYKTSRQETVIIVLRSVIRLNNNHTCRRNTILKCELIKEKCKMIKPT